MPPRTPTDALEADAVLFDLDGTLIDSTRATERAWVEWGRRLGLSDYVHTSHGLTAARIVADVFDDPSLRASALALAQELEVGDVAGITTKPGVLELLGRIPAHRWTIVTSCSYALAEARLRAAGLPRPSSIVTADDVSVGKPAPEGYLLGASRVGVPIDRCVVVEDTPVGLAAAHAAGARTLGVAGTHPAVDLHADVTVDTLERVSVSRRGETLRLAVGALAVPVRPGDCPTSYGPDATDNTGPD